MAPRRGTCVLSRGTGSIADLTMVVSQAFSACNLGVAGNGSVGAEELWMWGRELRLNREGQKYNGLWICSSPSTSANVNGALGKPRRRKPVSEGNATLG
jgi:hypothetical protein